MVATEENRFKQSFAGKAKRWLQENRKLLAGAIGKACGSSGF
jgi:hypothetical protein